MNVHVYSTNCCQEELAHTDSTPWKGLDSTLYFVSSLDWFFSRRDLFRVTTQSCSVVFFNLLTVFTSAHHADIGTALHVTAMFSMSFRWTELSSWRKVVYQTLFLPSTLSATLPLHVPAVSWRTSHPASSLRFLSQCKYYASSCSLTGPSFPSQSKDKSSSTANHTLWPGIYRVRIFCFPLEEPYCGDLFFWYISMFTAVFFFLRKMWRCQLIKCQQPLLRKPCHISTMSIETQYILENPLWEGFLGR